MRRWMVIVYLMIGFSARAQTSTEQIDSAEARVRHRKVRILRDAQNVERSSSLFNPRFDIWVGVAAIPVTAGFIGSLYLGEPAPRPLHTALAWGGGALTTASFATALALPREEPWRNALLIAGRDIGFGLQFFGVGMQEDARRARQLNETGGLPFYILGASLGVSAATTLLSTIFVQPCSPEKTRRLVNETLVAGDNEQASLLAQFEACVEKETHLATLTFVSVAVLGASYFAAHFLAYFLHPTFDRSSFARVVALFPSLIAVPVFSGAWIASEYLSRLKESGLTLDVALSPTANGTGIFVRGTFL